MHNCLRIGWSQADITPHRPVALRGQFNLRLATRVQDPLTLTALALSSDDDQAILVSIDSCSVDDEVLAGARAMLAERLPDFDPRKLIVCATHTHTAPFGGSGEALQKDEDHLAAIRARYPDYMTAAEYGALLTMALADACCQAWAARAAGFVAWGYSHAVVGENRRVRTFDDSATMYGSTSAAEFSHIEGHVDHGVNLLFTYDAKRALTGVLVNLACPSQASESGQDFISADFWHDAREELRRRHGSGLFILPQCSAAGDQSPHRLIGTRAEARMLRLKYGDGVGRPLNAALRRDLARRIAGAVDDAEPAVRADMREKVAFGHQSLDLDLPHWDLSLAEYDALGQEIAALGEQLAELGDCDPLGAQFTALHCRRAWCQRAARRYEHPLPGVRAEVNVVRLGEIALVTAPFEFYLDFGDRIKGRSAAEQTFVVQLTSLASGGCYLPTERAAAGLSYGAVPASCRVAPAGGQMVVEAAVRTIAELFAAHA
ncbi:MAG: hypothetical protein HZB16_05775 [Armatimonadetes bacterium]|nr:hypothetical protein [Armatimonadota bacterium]